jgi:uncharacterized membrane protein YjfL (UPF0719 family)
MKELDFIILTICFITFEEVDRDATTKVNIGKASVGVSMGTTSVGAG